MSEPAIDFRLRTFDACVSALEAQIGSPPTVVDAQDEWFSRAAAKGDPLEPSASVGSISSALYFVPDDDDFDAEGPLQSWEDLITSLPPAAEACYVECGGVGYWAAEAGRWVILSLKLWHDETRPDVPVTFASWRVQSGSVIAVWRGATEPLGEVMGLHAWPKPSIRHEVDIEGFS